MECIHCNKICHSSNSLRNHERLCKLNPDRQILVSNFIKYNATRKELRIKGSNQFTKARELGLPKPIISQETREKISKAGKGRKYSDDYKKRHSEVMKRVVQSHPDSYTKNNVVGRVKIIDYNGIRLKGSWEVLVAKWLDSFNIKWDHETKYFEYEWNGIRRYYPDFYLPEYNIYIEVKGYERERDLAKWKSVPNLVVFKLADINAIKKNKLGLYRLSLITS
jgi:hypothetical protein